jgi:hypothetical protein
MKNVELDLEPAEYLSEFDESETGYEEDSEAFDDIPTSDVELEPDEEVRRFPSACPPSTAPFALRLRLPFASPPSSATAFPRKASPASAVDRTTWISPQSVRP